MSGSPSRKDKGVDDDPARSANSATVIDSLRELVWMLDQRVPHLERAGEAKIASDAAALRAEAIARIEEFERAGS